MNNEETIKEAIDWIKSGEENKRVVTNPDIVAKYASQPFGTQVFDPKTKEGRDGLRKALAASKQFYEEAGVNLNQ